ncbi:MAG: lactate racemase domain-containing protein, partial [Caldilineaceae bacterium]|nr:lactate racemase domain-containing protein [Caldilineaceae bacterium]
MNSAQTVTVPSRSWFGDVDRTLTFPAGWELHVCGSVDAPALSSEQIAAAFDSPIGTPRIREVAEGRASAAIIVDDLSRPTPAAEMLPYVLEELAEAGVPKGETVIVVGGGTHRPLTDEEMVKKVGAEVAANYATTSHDFMAGDLVAYGSLEDGTPIYINRIVAEAEFKICVGGIFPHGSAGFGGGAKLIVPGVAGFATIFHFHGFSPTRGQGNIERRKPSEEDMGKVTLIDGGVRDLRDVAEEVAGRIGLDMVVNSVITSRRQIAGLFVGDFVKAHRAGALFAQRTYGTTIPNRLRQEADVVVCNGYPLDADPVQGSKALWPLPYFEREP